MRHWTHTECFFLLIVSLTIHYFHCIRLYKKSRKLRHIRRIYIRDLYIIEFWELEHLVNILQKGLRSDHNVFILIWKWEDCAKIKQQVNMFFFFKCPCQVLQANFLAFIILFFLLDFSLLPIDRRSTIYNEDLMRPKYRRIPIITELSKWCFKSKIAGRNPSEAYWCPKVLCSMLSKDRGTRMEPRELEMSAGCYTRPIPDKWAKPATSEVWG